MLLHVTVLYASWRLAAICMFTRTANHRADQMVRSYDTTSKSSVAVIGSYSEKKTCSLFPTIIASTHHKYCVFRMRPPRILPPDPPRDLQNSILSTASSCTSSASCVSSILSTTNRLGTSRKFSATYSCHFFLWRHRFFLDPSILHPKTSPDPVLSSAPPTVLLFSPPHH